MSRGNTVCSKRFLKQLIQGGTRIPIESVLGLFNEKLIITELFIIYVVLIITGIVLYQHGVQSVGLSMPTKARFICVFLNLQSKA